MAPNDPRARGTPHPELHGLNPGELLARGLHTAQPSAGSGPWQPPTPEELAALLPQYRIESLLGHGGMGAVYKGTQVALDRPVAIKLLPAELAADANFVARFHREARTLARLQHSSIVAVHDFGQTTQGHLYFVMEYVEGTDLHRILKGPGLRPEQAYVLIGQICEALHYAHQQGVIHRDIKPANILITADGRAKVADFGLARPAQDETGGLTQTNMIMGTPDYMAPEQRTGVGRADHRADIFALGVMLYEMLTGQRPHGAFQPPSQRVQVDVRIDEVVLKALQQELARRYQQASEMKVDVDRIRTSPPEKSAPPRKSLWKPLLIAAAVIISMIVALVSIPIFARFFAKGPARRPVVTAITNPSPPSVSSQSTLAGWKPMAAPATASVQTRGEEGWIQIPEWRPGKEVFADGAVRFRTRWTERGYLWVHLRAVDERVVELRLNPRGLVQLIHRENGEERSREASQLAPFTVGQEVAVEFAVVGTKAFARVDGHGIVLSDVPSWRGVIRFFSGEGERAVWIKPGEVIHFDGVADPLKALGWGTDEQKPAPATPSAPVLKR